VFDPEAVVEHAMAVKSKEERKAVFNAIAKLRELGDRLASPHMIDRHDNFDALVARAQTRLAQYRP
jgi:hypothetical protein